MNPKKEAKIQRKQAIREAKIKEKLKRRNEIAKGKTKAEIKEERRQEALKRREEAIRKEEIARKKREKEIEARKKINERKRVDEKRELDEVKRKEELRLQKIRNSENKRDRKVIRLQGNKVIILNTNFRIRAHFDIEQKKMQFSRENVYTKILSPEDIVSYEIKSKKVVVSNSRSMDNPNRNLGRTIGMGFLFGGAGAMASALADRGKEGNTKKYECIDDVYTLDIRINDVQNPAFICELDNEQAAVELKAILPIIIGKKKQIVSKTSELDGNYEQLLKYKDLYDKKIITKTEFEKKKKQILG